MHRFVSLLGAMSIVLGVASCGVQDPAREVAGAWIHVDPPGPGHGGHVIAVEFLPEGKVIFTVLERDRNFLTGHYEGRNVATRNATYSMLEGNRINFTQGGQSSIVHFERKRDRLVLRGDDGGQIEEYRSADGAAIRSLYEEAVVSRQQERWKSLEQILAFGSERHFAILRGGDPSTAQPPEDGPLAITLALENRDGAQANVRGSFMSPTRSSTASGTITVDAWETQLQLTVGEARWLVWPIEHGGRHLLLASGTIEGVAGFSWNEWMHQSQGAASTSNPNLVLMPDDRAVAAIQEQRRAAAERAAAEAAERQRQAAERAANRQRRINEQREAIVSLLGDGVWLRGQRTRAGSQNHDTVMMHLRFDPGSQSIVGEEYTPSGSEPVSGTFEEHGSADAPRVRMNFGSWNMSLQSSAGGTPALSGSWNDRWARRINISLQPVPHSSFEAAWDNLRALIDGNGHRFVGQLSPTGRSAMPSTVMLSIRLLSEGASVEGHLLGGPEASHSFVEGSIESVSGRRHLVLHETELIRSRQPENWQPRSLYLFVDDESAEGVLLAGRWANGEAGGTLALTASESLDAAPGQTDAVRRELREALDADEQVIAAALDRGVWLSGSTVVGSGDSQALLVHFQRDPQTSRIAGLMEVPGVEGFELEAVLGRDDYEVFVMARQTKRLWPTERTISNGTQWRFRVDRSSEPYALESITRVRRPGREEVQRTILQAISEEALGTEREQVNQLLAGRGYQFSGTVGRDSLVLTIRSGASGTIVGHAEYERTGMKVAVQGTIATMSGRHVLQLNETSVIHEQRRTTFRPNSYRLMLETHDGVMRLGGIWNDNRRGGRILFTPTGSAPE